MASKKRYGFVECDPYNKYQPILYYLIGKKKYIFEDLDCDYLQEELNNEKEKNND